MNRKRQENLGSMHFQVKVIRRLLSLSQNENRSVFFLLFSIQNRIRRIIKYNYFFRSLFLCSYEIKYNKKKNNIKNIEILL